MANRKTPWRRLTAEGAVIVASILLAFTVEAWWSGHQEQNEVDEAIAALHDEVTSTREHLRDRIELNQARLRGIVAGLRLSPSEVASLDVVSADSLQNHFFFYAPFVPSDGALEALLSANVLEHVDDQSLRQLIAALPGILRRPEAQLEFVRAAITGLADRMVELELFEPQAICQETGEGCDSRQSVRAMLTDRPYREMLGHKVAMLGTYNSLLSDLVQPLDELLEALAQH